MIIKEIIDVLEQFAPRALQEKWDNSGVQVGDINEECSGVVLTVDVTEKIIAKALESGANLIISHHPLIFSPVKSVTCSTSLGRMIFKAIKHGIVIYSGHTSFDSVKGGVSFIAARKLGLKKIKILAPQQNSLKKIVVYVPEAYVEIVENAAFGAGAGVIGDYDSCGFRVAGKGSFKAGENTNPFVGERGKLHRENEVRFETVVPGFMLSDVLNAIIGVHPYEEPAYDVFDLNVPNNNVGIGVVGDIDVTPFDEFAEKVKKVFGLNYIKCSRAECDKVSRVALTGGSGSSFIGDAVRSGADVYLTGDLKYHDLSETDYKVKLMDIGHFESEKFIIEIFYDILTKNFHNFATHIVKEYHNPVDYV